MSGKKKSYLVGLVCVTLPLACAKERPPAEPVVTDVQASDRGAPGDRDPLEGSTLARACRAMAAVRGQPHCRDLEHLQMSETECFQGIAKERRELSEPKRAALDDTLECLTTAGDCQAVVDCWASMSVTAGTEERGCGDGAFGPLKLGADDVAKRYGHDVERFSAAPTTKELPIEVCGVQGELGWLVETTCDDGTNPFSTPQQAHRSREGNVGGGGRCGHVIDLYRVPCPEGAYEVYMDMYMCGPSESF
jgi:hypothetical protein